MGKGVLIVLAIVVVAVVVMASVMMTAGKVENYELVHKGKVTSVEITPQIGYGITLNETTILTFEDGYVFTYNGAITGMSINNNYAIYRSPQGQIIVQALDKFY